MLAGFVLFLPELMEPRNIDYIPALPTAQTSLETIASRFPSVVRCVEWRYVDFDRVTSEALDVSEAPSTFAQ